jgi:Ca-activated chloride channel family protein
MIFRFASPWFLVLLAVPWLWLGIQGLKRLSGRNLGQTRPALHVAALATGDPDRDTGAAPPVTPGLVVSRLLVFLKVLGLSLMIMALARPQAGEKKIKVMTEGVNIVLALDLSESMSALDFKRDDKIVNRLEAVKKVVDAFILNRQGDRIGMVVFGSHAFTQLPLTRDYNTISFMLSHLTIGAAGPSTAIGDAVGIALKRLADVKAKSNIIILLTDGKSNAGSLSWQDAADLAKAREVKIYTVGVGSKGKAPFLVNGLFGQQYVYRQVDVDWQALETIAETTGGQFFRAGDTDGLKQVYKTIDAMEKTTVEVDKWVDFQEMFARVLVAGLVFYLGALILSRTWLLRIPGR